MSSGLKEFLTDPRFMGVGRCCTSRSALGRRGVRSSLTSVRHLSLASPGSSGARRLALCVRWLFWEKEWSRRCSLGEGVAPAAEFQHEVLILRASSHGTWGDLTAFTVSLCYRRTVWISTQVFVPKYTYLSILFPMQFLKFPYIPGSGWLTELGNTMTSPPAKGQALGLPPPL